VRATQTISPAHEQVPAPPREDAIAGGPVLDNQRRPVSEVRAAGRAVPWPVQVMRFRVASERRGRRRQERLDRGQASGMVEAILDLESR
jgi:hypothetical protein